ncbi:AQG_2a_G0057000.mRNA.1.CDS.1 [Saccharomyces cerevisiae]|mgnify:FL=1|jgi:serine/threonine protein kinase|uniref:non-specific serine/threonine protein kinase n=3 Tax=Saccharomyces cerevisiae TaxID=4932 RepID=C8ZJD3_YEAS8|nr:Dbf20p [Saccharomyces cerevisiae YJM1615]AJV98941.1 Dbf20p [Saccharomyces cerevisiae YJM320]AJV99821.1 Dbf20p [Saccharomyces cerevisiae YJM428]AJW00247.1 Dbf20p [Saccharomyces cerevisiae YJM450]AJW01551.1 Dbf20p [Saccharomyces cerevisiae YJM1383]AJW01986.1 Dbf20p [Saccharomyces cerevisiae YJM1385]AJW02403.1 Dbf20p [Saccharomyces cerevisiae YJM1386]AJW05889.1 Dbf20p [Saccharomyces cerevisiae YJM1415]AJW09370.1 Dbf20p [Saccharomyces cerevisiae YJM1444]AJW13147.1 Dbf20p [Saccharomyces cere
MFSRSDREVDDLAGNMSHLGFYDLNIPKPTSPQAQYRPARKSENGRLTPGLPRSYKPCNSGDQDTFKNRISLNHSPKKLPKDFHERASQSKTQRVVNVCQLYFLDYYCDMFDYVISRRQRTKQVLRYLEQQRSVKNVSNKVLNEEWALYLQREHEVLRKRRLKPKHKDFQILTQVGQGGYGQVYLAKKKDSDEICALKILNKKLLFKLNETNHVLTERDILTTTRSDWLVKLLYAFQDPESLYLAMEFVPGGDFRTLLINTRILKSGHARFYISEMFCAVNALHELGYTHRDLKPENFLIDATGHIKLTDFGLAAGTVSNERIESMKIRLEEVKNLEFPAFTERSIEDRRKIYHNMRKTEINYANSMVGSPDYMALEVLEGKKYDFTVDYWSLGCMLFESLVGYTPFSGSSTNETYENLRYWKKTLRRPRTEDRRAAFSDRTWDLITRLIADPINRVRSFEQVRKMSYFAEINFETLRTSSPPFIPQLDDETDAGYFDDFTNEEDMAKYADVFKRQNKLSAMVDDSAVDSKLVGFTFRHRDGKQGSSGILYNGSEHSDPFSTFY